MTQPQPTRWTLYHRLLLLGLLPAMSMFLLMLLFLTQARLEDARESLFSGSQLIADNLAPALEFPVIAGNTAELTAILEQTLERSLVRRIQVRDSDGRILVDVGDDVQSSAAPIHHFESAIMRDPVKLDDASPFFEMGADFAEVSRRIGTIRVSVSEARLAEEQHQILWTSAGIGLILFAGTLIFTGRLAYRLSEPIERLAQSVHNLPDGPLEVARGDTLIARELEVLREAIGAMAERLRSSEVEREIAFEQLAEAKERAEAASDAKSDFLAVMSHELRTPLHGIIGMLQLLEEESLTARQHDYLVTARCSSEDQLVIINDLLDFSRIERGRLQLDHMPFDPRSVVENCFASFRHQAQSNHLDYQLRLRGDWEDGLEVEGDPGRLRQILAHLIGNAIKFTPEGHVIVTVTWTLNTETEGLLACDIDDSGAGIPAERLGDMFDPFEQLDGTVSRRFGGTGLGLPLVQRLVELMGGHVSVDSEPGCGSRFGFRVPMAVSSVHLLGDAEEPTGEEVANSSGGSKHAALVVEDNPVNQRVAARLLAHLGFQVRCACNGAVALDDVQSREGHYDVILMDCQMPDLDGWEATRRIRDWERRNRTAPTAIIAMTADVLPQTETSCLDAGMDAYLPKPVSRDQLRTALRRLINL